MSAWSHLPNSHHIDWALVSLKENPELWTAAWSAAWAAARSAARVAAWDAHSGTTWFSARDEAWAAIMAAARDAAWFAARDAARTSIAALIAWDDCDHFLNMSYEKLKVWAVLSEDPRAVLLLPMAYVKEKLNEQWLVTSA